jgi:biuret amidohydrolase
MLTDMYAYFYSEKKPLPDEFDDYLDYTRAAVVSIDMHRGHLEDSPDCTCPGPRGREIIEATDHFHRQCRTLGIPIIHVEMKLRKDGSDDRLGNYAAWRLTFPMTVGKEALRNADNHNLEGSRWVEFVTEVKPEDYIVDTKRVF